MQITIAYLRDLLTCPVQARLGVRGAGEAWQIVEIAISSNTGDDLLRLTGDTLVSKDGGPVEFECLEGIYELIANQPPGSAEMAVYV